MKHLYTSTNELFAEIKYTKNIYTNYMKHSHCMLCISFIESGKIDIEINGNILTLEPNQMVIFNPRQLHCMKKIEKKTLGYYTVYLDELWCLEIQKNLFKASFSEFVPSNTNLIRGVYAQDIIALIKKIYMEKKVRTHENILKEQMSSLFEKYCMFQYLSNLNKEHELIQKVKQYIYEHINDEIFLEDLSKYTRYSKNHITKVFQSQLEISPKKYIINQKINKAKQLIVLNENLSLTEISYSVGFYDQSHFNKHFKRIFGVNPRAYR